MAGVQTNADALVLRDSIDNCAQLLECRANFAAFARHRFEQNRRMKPVLHRGVQRFGDSINPCRNALTYMTAGMQIVKRPREKFKPRQILAQRAPRKIQHIRICRAGIQRVRRVRDDGREMVLVHERNQRGGVVCIKRLRVSAARIAGKILKSVRADRKRLSPHCEIALRRAQMTADVQHFCLRYSVNASASDHASEKTISPSKSYFSAWSRG